MVMVGNVCHVFTKTVFVPSKRGVALDHTCQESTPMKLRKVSDVQKVSLSLASVVALVEYPQRESFFEHLG